MRTLPLVLALDVAGQPGRWISFEESAYYYAKGSIAWEMAPVSFTIYGGTNIKTGKQSTLTMNTIVAIKGQHNGKHSKRMHIPPLTNKALFRRDLNICAYCGDEFRTADLTRDHVIPTSKGGKDIWTNVVASCERCNRKKDDKRPEEAGMQLIYVPYSPVREEWLILENKRILFDQMQYLIKRVPKESRLRRRI